MDMSRNRIPDHVETIHLIAVCGTGMGALACMLKDLGYRITGSDQNVYPPMSDFLKSKNIPVAVGFDGANIAYGPDLVIVGNAVRKDNPEVITTDQMGMSFCSMPQALNGLVAKNKKPIVVTGTHGKTTTSSLMAWVLFQAGLDPSFMIGGLLQDFNSNYRLGSGEHIVIEGDEYDTAFFDKGSKFLHYIPYASILTSIEFDHADIFRDLKHVKQTFRSFIKAIPEGRRLFAFDGDENVASVISGAETVDSRDPGRDIQCHAVNYGKLAQSPWRLGDIQVDPPWNCFEVLKNGTFYGEFRTRMVGEHNLLNALSVIATADHIGIPLETIQAALRSFAGIRRRQEVRGVKRGITVMDDFAHHPSAVRETLKAVKPFYPNGRIIAVFEPRTNSSMRKVFQNIYPRCFDEADLICVREPSLLSKIPIDERFSSRKLVDDLKKQGKRARYFKDTDAIMAFVSAEAMPGDLVLIMSNGGFDNIHERLLEIL